MHAFLGIDVTSEIRSSENGGVWWLGKLRQALDKSRLKKGPHE